MLLIALLPFATTVLPPLADYPNHLADDYVLANLQKNVWLNHMYKPNWGVLPNIGSDVVEYYLLKIFRVVLAGKIVAVGALLAPMVGILVFNRVLFGRHALWPFAGGVVLYNCAYLLGFLNFLFGIAAGFSVAAIWLRWREHHPVWAIFGVAAGSVVAFFCHITSLLLLGVLIGSYELETIWRGRISLALRRIPPLIAVSVPTTVLYFLSPSAGVHGNTEWLPLVGKVLLLLGSFMNYDAALDSITALLIISFIIIAINKELVIVPRQTKIAITILVLAYCAAPSRIGGGAYFDLRFSIMAGYLAFAGMRENPSLPRWTGISMVACFLALTAVRTAVVTFVWQQQDRQVAFIEDLAKQVPPGSRVLIATAFPSAEGYWRTAPKVAMIDQILLDNYHLPTIFLAERGAFSQDLFADPSQQPIVVRPAYRRSASPTAAYGPPNYMWLTDRAREIKHRDKYPYLVKWKSKFDYLILMNIGAIKEPEKLLSRQVSLLGRNQLAALFRVDRHRERQ